MKRFMGFLLLLAVIIPLASATVTQYNLTDGLYTIKIFNGTGTINWTPETPTVEVLVIGGGGAGHGNGATNSGSGGSAGAFVYVPSISVPSSVNITVGQGGIGVSDANGSNGEDSRFDTTIATGGNGGNQTGSSPPGQPGGDGSSHAGYSGAGSDAGWGGNGTYSSITETSVCYTEGGGGGFTNGGLTICGGGRGESFGEGNAAPGINGTGSGGGGVSSSGSNPGKDGGSGIVVVRYLTPTFTANFTQTPNPSYVNESVQFSDASGFLPVSWDWNFGDATTSTTQNPTHTYGSTGTYNVTLTVHNDTSSTSVSHNHVVSTASSFTQQDIWMTAQYTLRIHVVDSNNLPIVSATMVDSGNGNTYSTTNGTIYATYPFQAVVGVVSSVGYQSRQFSAFVDRDTDVTVQLAIAPVNTTQTNNIIWQPYAIAIQVLDANLNPIVNDPVEMTAYDSSLPGGLAGGAAYFQTTYGASAETAASMFSANTTYRGNTDDNGFISTQVVNVIEYKVVTKDTAGNAVTTLIWPHGSYCQIKTGTALVPGIALIGVAQNNIYKNSTFNTTFWEPNTTTACMGVNVYDSTGQTTIVSAWWKLIDNSTTWWTNTSISGYGPVNSTKCVPHVPYQQWKWGGITG